MEKRIMVVDDEVAMSKLMARILTKSGQPQAQKRR